MQLTEEFDRWCFHEEKFVGEANRAKRGSGRRRVGSAVGEGAGFQEEGELVALRHDIAVSEVGVDEDELVLAERVGGEGGFLGGEKRRGAGGEAGPEFFGLYLGAAVVGVDVEQTAAGAVGPSEEGIGATVEGVEEPDFVGVFREATAVEDAGDDAVAAAVAGEDDAADEEIFRFEIGAGAEGGDDLGHEVFPAVGVLEFATEGLGGVVRALGDDENGVLAAGDELLDEVIGRERAGDGVVPAVEMDGEVNGPGLAEAARNEERDGVVEVVLFGWIVLAFVGVPIGAVRMREGRRGKRGENEAALRAKVSSRVGAAPAREDATKIKSPPSRLGRMLKSCTYFTD